MITHKSGCRLLLAGALPFTLLAAPSEGTLNAKAGTTQAHLTSRVHVTEIDGEQSAQPAPTAPAGSKTHFTLKSGDHLDQSAAPNIAKRVFTVNADFDAHPGGGVIVAQGGAKLGFSLFVDSEGYLTFLIRSEKHSTSVRTSKTVSGPHTAVAHLAENGVMTLILDAHPAVHVKAPGTIAGMPVEGLDVGSDQGAPVGPYNAPNPFHGTINSVVIDLATP